MRPSVAAGFEEFSADLEGERIPWPYLDSKDDKDPRTPLDGLVTVGTGNLIDPVSLSMGLPWRLVADRAKRAATEADPMATRGEIHQWWTAVKVAQHRKQQGGGRHYDLSPLRLTKEAVIELVHRKLHEVDRQLATMFAGWATWPADAQLSLISWAWAVGAHAEYPKMVALLRAGNFAGAAEEIRVTDGHGGEPGTYVLRNMRNRRLLINASNVIAAGMDPEPLRWPSPLLAPVVVVVDPGNGGEVA